MSGSDRYNKPKMWGIYSLSAGLLGSKEELGSVELVS
jgi:hypothetical protein